MYVFQVEEEEAAVYQNHSSSATTGYNVNHRLLKMFRN